MQHPNVEITYKFPDHIRPGATATLAQEVKVTSRPSGQEITHPEGTEVQIQGTDPIRRQIQVVIETGDNTVTIFDLQLQDLSPIQ